MNEIQYIGEHLLPGQIGQFLLVLGFVASILATLAYFFATQRRDLPDYKGWRNIGRVAFTTHTLSVFGIIGIIFYIMLNKYYEYHYVFQHVSEDLPFKYIFSAFWEGQEGSFLLWMFWHVVLGMILIFTAKKWESPVLAVISFVEIFIHSMILGIYIGEWKVGSNPLVLFRDVSPLPLFNKADYVVQLGQFADGLNPLLQNYWMTIHPPTLFLGFSSTLVPFAFAIAGLWLGKHKEWLSPVLPWALFSGCILGTGILMGGAWAYEALSFGGYWAWDPVENTSLVPWLVLLGGLHTNLVARSTGHSIKSTYIFYLLTFIMIVYSTTLTRSGVLGDSSVHAFTEMGLENQLLLFILSCIFLSIFAYFARARQIPVHKKEEALSSKEFWMFIGSLVLLFSAILITFTTSIPVYNKVAELFNYDLNWSSPVEVVAHYNKYQLWIGVFIGLLSGFSQFLRYKEHDFSKNKKRFLQHTIIGLVLSAVLTFLTCMWINADAWQYKLLMFMGIFASITNLDYLIFFIKGNLKIAGSSIAHIGFGLMIIGVLASGLNKKHISTNPFAQRGLISDDMLGQNILLFEGEPMFMSGYKVTYVNDTIVDKTRFYTVNYQKLNQNGEVVEEFDLHPNALYDNKFTKVAAFNPSTKHYWYKDIFSHIPALPPSQSDAEAAKEIEDSLNYQTYVSGIGELFNFEDIVPIEDSTFTKKFSYTINGINRNPVHEEYVPEMGDLAVGLPMTVQFEGKDSIFNVEPVIVIRGELLYNFPAQINDLALKIRLTESSLNQIIVPESKLAYQDFELKEGDVINFNGQKITFAGFNRRPSHPSYVPEKEDIAVGAMLKVEGNDNSIYNAQPIYFIRGNRPFNLKDEIEELGLHFRFNRIDPTKESILISVAHHSNSNPVIPIEIATNSFRDDFIVLEAIEFPGINFFWLGSIMMMLGLGMSMLFRMAQRRKINAV